MSESQEENLQLISTTAREQEGSQQQSTYPIPQWYYTKKEKVLIWSGTRLFFSNLSKDNNTITLDHDFINYLVQDSSIDFSKVTFVNLAFQHISDEGLEKIVRNCNNLTKLNLAAAQNVTDKSLEIVAKHCKNLKDLRLIGHHDQITDKGLLAITQHCLNLEKLYHNNPISNKTFQAIVDGCPKLTYLGLINAGLTKIPENIGDKVPELKTLFLANNHIEKIPRSLSKLKNLELIIDNNPLQEPPIEVVNQGIEAMQRYFEELDKGSSVSKKLKVVLIGDGEAGKTTMLNLINRQKNPRTKEIDRTIHLSLKTVEIKTSDKLEELLVYDCGGQKQYLPGQAPFLTDSALYLLVISAKDIDPNNYLRFLVLLQARAPRAVIQIILSKCDLVDDTKAKENAEKVQNEVNRFIEERKKANGQDGNDSNTLCIQPDVMLISIHEGDLIHSGAQSKNETVREDLLQKISDVSSEIPTVGQIVPKSWDSVFQFVDCVRTHCIEDEKYLFQRMEEKKPDDGQQQEEDSDVGSYSSESANRSNHHVESNNSSSDDASLQQLPQNTSIPKFGITLTGLLVLIILIMCILWRHHQHVLQTKNNPSAKNNDCIYANDMISEIYSQIFIIGYSNRGDKICADISLAPSSVKFFIGFVIVVIIMIGCIVYNRYANKNDNETAILDNKNDNEVAILDNNKNDNETAILDNNYIDDDENEKDLSTQQYIKNPELLKLWTRFQHSRNENIEEDSNPNVNTSTSNGDVVFKDAMMLLEAQGEIYAYDGLVFLRPQFITDLIAPLVDHLLKVDKEEIKCFLDEIENNEPNVSKSLQDSLKKFIKSGTLGTDDLNGNNLLLRFLWRKIERLDQKDYTSLTKMLKDCGVIFLSSFWEEEENDDENSKGIPHPVVLYRLPIEPLDRKSLDKAWPAQCPENKTHFEIRIEFLQGCPVNVAAYFAASAHSLGHCSQAWLNGALVTMKDNTAIRAEYVKAENGQYSDYLLLSIRAPTSAGLSLKDHLVLLPDVYKYMRQEKQKRLPGLRYDIVWACPECICRNNNPVTTFAWSPPDEMIQTSSSFEMKGFCDVCNRNIDIMDIVEKESTDQKNSTVLHQVILARLERIEEKVDDIPTLMIDMVRIKCPYMFRFITEDEFKEIKKNINASNNGGVAEQIGCKIDQIQSILDWTKDFVDVFSQDDTHEGDHDSRRASYISSLFGSHLFGRKRVVYLVLYCGCTYTPMVSYKVENTVYNEKVRTLAKVGATMCTLGIKASIVLSTAGTLISAFGYPFVNIDSDSIEKVKLFLDKINEENDKSNAFLGKQDGGLKTPKELDDFHSFLIELEKNNKMRQLGSETDKNNLKDKSWSDSLTKALVRMKDGKKFITWVDKNLETSRLGYTMENVDGLSS